MERARRDEIHEWMTRLADGDRAAFTPLFSALRPLLSRFAARSLSAADAEDAAQVALLAVFARASEFDRSRDAVSWILGIAAWEMRTVRTRERRRRESPGAVAPRLADPAPDPEEAVLMADLHRAAEEALGRLTPDDADVLRAAARGERDTGSAAFRKRLSRALARLRAVWSSTHGTR